MQKRFYIISFAVLCVVVTLAFCWLCLPTRVRLSGAETATLTYKVNGYDIEATLTYEEALTVAQILNGKVPVMTTSSCGYSPDVAITMGGKNYCLAMDKCGTMQIAYTFKYIILTDAQRAEIEAIFEKYGGTFPCI